MTYLSGAQLVYAVESVVAADSAYNQR